MSTTIVNERRIELRSPMKEQLIRNLKCLQSLADPTDEEFTACSY